MVLYITEPGIPDLNLPEPSRPVDLPSVHSDERGSIQRMSGYNVLFTRAGFMRSGDSHPNNQYDVVLSGRAELLTRENERDVWRILYPNDMVKICSYVPHLFRFQEDCVMLEWWDGPFSCWYFKRYRDYIDGNGS